MISRSSLAVPYFDYDGEFRTRSQMHRHSCGEFKEDIFKNTMCAKWLQWCPTLCDPTNYSPPGSSVHRILQARILEWVAMPFSGVSSQPRDRNSVSYVSCAGMHGLYHQHHLGKQKHHDTPQNRSLTRLLRCLEDLIREEESCTSASLDI